MQRDSPNMTLAVEWDVNPATLTLDRNTEISVNKGFLPYMLYYGIFLLVNQCFQCVFALVHLLLNGMSSLSFL